MVDLAYDGTHFQMLTARLKRRRLYHDDRAALCYVNAATGSDTAYDGSQATVSGNAWTVPDHRARVERDDEIQSRRLEFQHSTLRTGLIISRKHKSCRRRTARAPSCLLAITLTQWPFRFTTQAPAPVSFLTAAATGKLTDFRFAQPRRRRAMRLIAFGSPPRRLLF